MIDIDLDTEKSVLYVKPETAFAEEDFVKLAQVVDPQIERSGGLAGIVIDAERFPGWESIGAMATHFRFVRDHQKDVKRVAVVTDSHVGDVAEHLASHFLAAEVRHFPAGQVDAARQWITAA